MPHRERYGFALESFVTTHWAKIRTLNEIGPANAKKIKSASAWVFKSESSIVDYNLRSIYIYEHNLEFKRARSARVGFRMEAAMPHPVDVFVGARLREYRIMRGMSQKDLGKCVDITFQQIQKYEKAVNRIGASNLSEFSNALAVNVSDFFDGAPTNGKRVQAVPIPRPSVENLKLVSSFEAIERPDIRKQILNIVTALSRSEVNANSA